MNNRRKKKNNFDKFLDNRERDFIQALQTVSFYARINHGDKAKDYGEIVDPVLKLYGIPTGTL